MLTKADYIQQLNLQPHAEGGWYRQVFHAATQRLDPASQAQRFDYTSIYFLLDESSPSHLHRLLHDELWYFHAGQPLTVHCLMPDGSYEALHLGSDLAAGQEFQARVPAGTIFGAEVHQGFALVSCMVAPGFDYRDFELLTAQELTAMYPAQASMIKRMAYAKLPAE